MPKDAFAGAAAACLRRTPTWVDEAIDVLRPVANRFENASTQLGQLLIAQQQLSEAITVLEMRKDAVSQGLLAACLLLTAETEAALSVLEAVDVRVRWAYGSAGGAVTRAGRPDLLRVLIERESLSTYMHHAVAERILRATWIARQNGDTETLPPSPVMSGALLSVVVVPQREDH